MYKIVLNQYTIGLILLFSTYFAANGQIIAENSIINYSNARLRSNHQPTGLKSIRQTGFPGVSSLSNSDNPACNKITSGIENLSQSSNDADFAISDYSADEKGSWKIN